MPKYVLSILLLCCSLLPCYANQLIIEPEMGRTPIIQALNQANHSVKLVMYGFTDESLLNALVEQQLRHKTLQIMLEKTPYKAADENNKIIAQFNQHHIPWHGVIPPFRLIHEKMLLLDEKKAIVMTFNFTRSSFKNERNFGLVIDDPKQVKAISALFSADWNHVPIVVQQPELVLSPDNSREKLLSLIGSAKHSLFIYAQSVNDYKIVGALVKAAQQGTKIKILTSNLPKAKQIDYLNKAGVTVRKSKRYYIHAKVMVIDQQKAILGSINLTRPSLDENRELAVMTTDKAIINQLLTTFEKDWEKASASPVSASTAKPQASASLTPFEARLLSETLKIVKHYVTTLLKN